MTAGSTRRGSHAANNGAIAAAAVIQTSVSSS
jgi:hypothetical protein